MGSRVEDMSSPHTKEATRKEIDAVISAVEEAAEDDWDGVVEAHFIFADHYEVNVTQALVALVIRLSRRVQKLEQDKANDD